MLCWGNNEYFPNIKAKGELMKKFTNLTIIKNEQIANEIFDMTLKAEDLPEISAGQFIMLYVGKGEHILPRPISICDVFEEDKAIRIVYQAVGKGTEIFSKAEPGDVLKAILPIGNGFDIKNGDNFALVGGGIGIPPLLYTAKMIKKVNPSAEITAFLGFRNNDTYLTADFENAGVNVKISTDDGSVGFKGNAVQNMGDSVFPIVYSCGPKPMLKAVAAYAENHGVLAQLSMEERMACGVGACVGCVVKMKDGSYKKACVDGPVFDGLEVDFNE
jgi:dihydroorotate dehydrogenase electron transfer subunit